jgi:antitoxin CptB
MDNRRKRLLYRATHRGTKEADFIIGNFFTERVADLPDAQLDAAEALLEESDIELVNWLMGREAIPERWQAGLFMDVLAYYRALRPD